MSVDDTANAPVTNHDLELWGGRLQEQIDGTRLELSERLDELTTRVDHIDTRLSALTTDVQRLERGMKTILDVVTESNDLLRDLRRLPERVQRLEDAVFRR